MMGDLGWYSLTKPPPSHSDQRERERGGQIIGGNFNAMLGKKQGTIFKLILLNKIHTFGILCNESHLMYVENFK